MNVHDRSLSRADGQANVVSSSSELFAPPRDPRARRAPGMQNTESIPESPEISALIVAGCRFSFRLLFLARLLHTHLDRFLFDGPTRLSGRFRPHARRPSTDVLAIPWLAQYIAFADEAKGSSYVHAERQVVDGYGRQRHTGTPKCPRGRRTSAQPRARTHARAAGVRSKRVSAQPQATAFKRGSHSKRKQLRQAHWERGSQAWSAGWQHH